MRKEVILAIILGLAIGGIILYGVKIANQSAQINSGTQSATLKNNQPSIVTPTPTTLTIYSPNNHSVSTESSISIDGKTYPKTTIAISGESSDDQIIESDDQGKFSATVKLISGSNKISIRAINPETHEPSDASLEIIYTTAQID